MAKEASQVLNSTLPDYRLTMDPAAFGGLVQNFGLPLVHYRAMRCPVGLTDPNDVRRGHEHHVHCSNGFIYKRIGVVTAIPTGNAADPKLIDIGFITGSTMQVTFDLKYHESDRKVYVLPYDRFFLDDPFLDQTEETIMVATWELVKANTDRNDRLRFEALKVEHVMDSAGHEYDYNDFEVVGGNIQWLPNKGPSVGQVYVVWYQYKPHWYCKMLVHELRVSPVADYMDANKVKLKRTNFAAILVRENVYRNEENDPQIEPTTRQQQAPDLDFGSR